MLCFAKILIQKTTSNLLTTAFRRRVLFVRVDYSIKLDYFFMFLLFANPSH